MKICVLTGGVGGAKFLLGVKAFLGWDPTGPGAARRPGRPTATRSPPSSTSATTSGCTDLQVCPDLDSCLYTLAGVSDLSAAGAGRTRPGRSQPNWPAYGAEAPWFSLGDKDIATHLMRTRMLDAGYPLSAVTAALCERWQPGVDAAADDRRAGWRPTSSSQDPADQAREQPARR